VTERTLDSFFGGNSEKNGGKTVERRLNVYLASLDGFRKYCQNCEFLAKYEETGSGMFPLRVHCKAEKCVK